MRRITTERQWEHVVTWLNEMTGWAFYEVSTHPEKPDRIESWPRL